MRSVITETVVPSALAETVFALISDFEAYPRHTEAVREVTVTAAGDGVVESAWSVNFRNGVLRWSERDRLDPVARRITFEQTGGDFEAFEGSWLVEQAGEDAVVRFEARFDLGMPSLAAIIDPIAADALTTNVHAILRGLLGDTVRVLAGTVA
jgi:ribosome-associated toxin RatA of RatAB toxin-antitoxin module